FQPASTLTGNFPFSFATFIYQAPANFNGVTTITARTNNNVSGSVNVQVICSTTAPAPVPTTPAGPLRPPSAGDGGLLGGGGSDGDSFASYLPSAFAASVAALIVGIMLATRRRSFAAVTVSSMQLPSAVARGKTGSSRSSLLLSLVLIGATWLYKRNR
ncbi:MAG TPA: hypothetical protein VG845_00495, partial [Dehalococcoidia bacterium]|nr:hypothetical protein [Dehalococcoidia bacterium]